METPTKPFIDQFESSPSGQGPIEYDNKLIYPRAVIELGKYCSAIDLTPIKWLDRRAAVLIHAEGCVMQFEEERLKTAVLTMQSLKRDSGWIPIRRLKPSSRISILYGSIDITNHFRSLWERNFGVWMKCDVTRYILHFSDAKSKPNFEHCVLQVEIESAATHSFIEQPTSR